MNHSAQNKTYHLTTLAVLAIGMIAYGIGLVNATMELNEKGYYLIVLLYGLFSFVSLQKNIRDKIEGVNYSKAYHLMCWCSAAIAVGLFVVGLYNAELLLSEKGFYAMAFLTSGFAAITVQKNIRDSKAYVPEIKPDAELAINEDS